MTASRTASLLFAALMAAGPLAAPASAAQPRPAKAAPGAAVESAPPFARVFLALRGCTSCSHCRSTIRKMVRSRAGKEGETRVDGGQVEVVYSRPTAVPLRQVIRGLAENRLHDLNLVDVLFEAEGSLSSLADGTARFTLRDTRQSFSVTIDRAVSRPADGAPVRLVALVEGWRGKGDVSLVAREVRGEVRDGTRGGTRGG